MPPGVEVPTRRAFSTVPGYGTHAQVLRRIHLLVDGVDDALVELLVKLVLNLLVLVQLVGNVLAQLGMDAVVLLVVYLLLLHNNHSLSNAGT